MVSSGAVDSIEPDKPVSSTDSKAAGDLKDLDASASDNGRLIAR